MRTNSKVTLMMLLAAPLLTAGTEYGVEKRLLSSSLGAGDGLHAFTGSTQFGVPPQWPTANFAEFTDSDNTTGFSFGRFVSINTGTTLLRESTVPNSYEQWYRLTHAKIELATECDDAQAGVQFSYIDRDGVTQTAAVTKSYDAANFVMTLEANLPAGGVDVAPNSTLDFGGMNFLACEPETRLVEWDVRVQTADEVAETIDMLGDKVKVETTIQNLRRDQLPFDFTTVTEDDSDAVIYSSGPLLLNIDPSANAIRMTPGTQAYTLSNGKYLEISDIDIPFREISGVTLTSNPSFNHTLSHTTSSVKVSFVSNNSFGNDKWIQLNLQTVDTTGGMATVDIIEDCELTNGPVLDFKVYFNGEPDSVSASDFDLQFTGTLALDGSASLVWIGESVEGPIYQLSVPVAGDGTLTVDVDPLSDLFFPITGASVDNVLPSNPVTVDQTAPSVTLVEADPSTLVNNGQCEVNFSFSEPVHIYTECGEILNPTNMNVGAFGPQWAQLGGLVTSTYFYLEPRMVNGVNSGSFDFGLIETEIRDLAGNTLQTATPVGVTVLPDKYQTWLLAHGQTTMMDFNDDEDGDGDSNMREFLRGQSPGLKDAGKFEDFRVIDFEGEKHGVLTFTAPDPSEENGAYHYFPVNQGDFLYMQTDLNYAPFNEWIEPSVNLADWANGDVKVEVVDPVVIPAGLPAPPTGWSYRQVRFIDSTSAQENAFMRMNLYEFPR